MGIAVNPKNQSRYLSIAVPLARGQLVWDAGMNPFRAMVGQTEVPCQTERIMRYDDGSASDVMVYVDTLSLASGVQLEWDPHREKTERDFEFHPKIGELRHVLPFKPDMAPMMNGAVCVQRRISRPGMEGVATFFHDCPAVRIDAILHNANPQSQESYERYLSLLTVPSGWEMHYVVSEPIGGLDGLLSDGQDHFVPQRMAREVTAILHPIGYTAWRDVQIDHGLAFADWTQHSAWAPHFVPLADWRHIPGMAQQQIANLGACIGAMDTGTQYPPKPWNYPESRRMGYLHPGYDRVAGATSGAGITYGGPCVTGSPELVMHALYESRYRRDRDRSAMIRADGEPLTLEDIQNEVLLGKIRFSSDNPGRFDKTGGKTLDGSLAWSVQIPAQASQERTDVLAYDTTDWAHRCRVNQWDAIALQIANHWPSRYRLRMEGELARCMLHSAKRIQGLVGYATQGLGLNVDRIIGWAAWACATAYALGANALRDRFRPDVAALAGLCKPARARNRTLCALTSGKQIGSASGTDNMSQTYHGQYAVCVGIQEGLLTQGLYACARAIGSADTDDIARDAALAVEWLRKGTQTVWSGATWKLSEKLPYDTRTIDSSAWAAGAYDPEQTRGLLGFFGLLLLEQGAQGTDSWNQLLATIQAMLGPKPRAALEAMKASACDSDSVLLAFAQKAALP